MKTFQQRLKEVREQKKISQIDLANKIGVDRTTISGYETKGREPNIQTLIMLADVLQVSIDYLVGRED